MSALPKTLTQRVALRQALGKDGYHDALLRIVAGNDEALQNWSQPLPKEEREQRKQVIFDLWLAGATEREVAEQLAISNIQIHKVIKLLTKNGHKVVSTEEPPIYNVWNFANCDPRFGQKHPGQIPGQAVVNLLLWLTEPFDFVVDPMGGGGTTIDVCKYLNRRYKVFDIDPRRPDIHKWDIRKGYPHLPQKPNFIFLGPPYWRLKQSEYSSDGSAMGSYANWLRFMGKLTKDSAKTVKPGGHVSLTIESFLDEKETGKFLYLAHDCLNLFEQAGLEGIQEISVNMPSQIKSFSDVLTRKSTESSLISRGNLLCLRGQLMPQRELTWRRPTNYSLWHRECLTSAPMAHFEVSGQ